ADEVSQGVGRLEASGLMTVSGTCFALTSDGRALVARRTGGLFGQVRLVEALLRRHDLVDRRWRVPEGALDAAVDAYQRGWRKADRGR
ncbi:MAG TPA: hypothetical protein VF557_05095, partial [Jatrophihabitans sp.]|uniref:hypothetical protein n=1 Tax=Jatrophihabitans sp. TaxID=1932789 RepID=UPI002EF1F623